MGISAAKKTLFPTLFEDHSSMMSAIWTVLSAYKQFSISVSNRSCGQFNKPSSVKTGNKRVKQSMYLISLPFISLKQSKPS